MPLSRGSCARAHGAGALGQIRARMRANVYTALLVDEEGGPVPECLRPAPRHLVPPPPIAQWVLVGEGMGRVDAERCLMHTLRASDRVAEQVRVSLMPARRAPIRPTFWRVALSLSHSAGPPPFSVRPASDTGRRSVRLGVFRRMLLPRPAARGQASQPVATSFTPPRPKAKQ